MHASRPGPARRASGGYVSNRLTPGAPVQPAHRPPARGPATGVPRACASASARLGARRATRRAPPSAPAAAPRRWSPRASCTCSFTRARRRSCWPPLTRPATSRCGRCAPALNPSRRACALSRCARAHPRSHPCMRMRKLSHKGVFERAPAAQVGRGDEGVVECTPHYSYVSGLKCGHSCSWRSNVLHATHAGCAGRCLMRFGSTSRTLRRMIGVSNGVHVCWINRNRVCKVLPPTQWDRRNSSPQHDGVAMFPCLR